MTLETNRKISIIIPVYCEELILEKSINELLKLRKLLKNYTVEYVFIDDASTDNSWAILEGYAKKHKENIVALKLVKNIGSWDAVFAGLKICSGDAAILISADGQEPLGSIIKMLDLWKGDIKAVYGIRNVRRDPVLQKLFASIYYFIFRFIGIKNYPKGGFDFSLIDRVIINSLLEMDEKNTPMTSLIFSLGYPFAYLPYDRQKRLGGKSKWTFSKRLLLSVNAFIGFSHAPVRLMAWLGFVYAFFSIGYAGLVVVMQWLYKQAPEGWSALQVFQSFTSGIQMFMLSTLGEYLWRILDEVRSRPRYTIQKILNKR